MAFDYKKEYNELFRTQPTVEWAKTTAGSCEFT